MTGRANGTRPALWPAALALLAILLGTEGVLRTWIHSPGASAFDPRYGAIAAPRALLLQSEEGRGRRRANSLGFLAAEPRTARAPLRVMLMGDSFAEALQVEQDETFARVAERTLPGLEVVNVARAGSFPAHYAAEIGVLDSLLTPDVIVVEVNDGDVREMLNPVLMAQARRFGAIRAPARPGGPGRWVVGHSALANFTLTRLSLLVDKERERLSHKLGIAPAGYVESTTGPVAPRASAIMDSLYLSMRRVNRPLVFLYIPDLDYFSTPPRHRYPERREFFRAFAARNGARLIDPTEAMLAEYRRTRQPLQGFANSVIGEGHINARGHALLGAVLARELATMPEARR